MDNDHAAWLAYLDTLPNAPALRAFWAQLVETVPGLSVPEADVYPDGATLWWWGVLMSPTYIEVEVDGPRAEWWEQNAGETGEWEMGEPIAPRFAELLHRRLQHALTSQPPVDTVRTMDTLTIYLTPGADRAAVAEAIAQLRGVERVAADPWPDDIAVAAAVDKGWRTAQAKRLGYRVTLAEEILAVAEAHPGLDVAGAALRLGRRAVAQKSTER